MGELRIGLNVRTRGFPQAIELTARAPERLTGAAQRSVRRGLQLLETEATRAIMRRARGMYWDINSDVRDTATGAQGTVTTPPNKPHEIVAKGRALRFLWPDAPPGIKKDKDGFVYLKRVNHPGSNAPDWTQDLEGYPEAFADIVAEEAERAIG